MTLPPPTRFPSCWASPEMKQPWKIIILLLGIFVAGGVTGGLVTLRIWKEKMGNRPVPEEWAPRHLKRLSDRLALTPAQQEQLRPVVRRNMEQLGRVRNTFVADTQTVVEAMQQEIAQMLTPEQRDKFAQMNREVRDARESREKAERAKRPKPSHPAREPAPPAKPPGN